MMVFWRPSGWDMKPDMMAGGLGYYSGVEVVEVKVKLIAQLLDGSASE